jgi:hypothetical protein
MSSKSKGGRKREMQSPELVSKGDLGIPPRPEPKSEPLSLKLKKSSLDALIKVAEEHGYTKSAMAETIIDIFLRERGLLK